MDALGVFVGAMGMMLVVSHKVHRERDARLFAEHNAANLAHELQVTKEELGKAQVELGALRGGHHPAMAAALADAPSFFERARQQEEALRRMAEASPTDVPEAANARASDDPA